MRPTVDSAPTSLAASRLLPNFPPPHILSRSVIHPDGTPASSHFSHSPHLPMPQSHGFSPATALGAARWSSPLPHSPSCSAATPGTAFSVDKDSCPPTIPSLGGGQTQVVPGVSPKATCPEGPFLDPPVPATVPCSSDFLASVLSDVIASIIFLCV